MDKIRVLLVDDHAIVRTGLATLIEAKGGIEVVGEAASGDEAVKKALKLKPDVVVMDILMPGKDGIEATRGISAILPETRVLILTTSTVPTDLSRALAAGAVGIVSKASDNSVLVDAIKAVARGERTISPDLADILDSAPSAPTFTKRQLEILRYAARGLSYPEIAKLYGVSTITVKKHIEVILAKFNAANRSEAIALALQERLIRL